MESIAVQACAKINLSLAVGPLQPDGYHPVEMVLCSVDCFDTVCIDMRASGVSVEVDSSHLPAGPGNIAHRAASAFLTGAGLDAGVHIRIQKAIPIAAGLAGGSADAAAVLTGMQRLFGDPLTGGALTAIAASLGSDVPFCLGGGLALATGRGTDLQYLPPLAEGPTFVLVNPGVPLSTADVYRRFDELAPGPWPDTAGLVRSLAQGDWAGAASRMANMLEPAAISLCPVIPHIRDTLLREGALAARMSGSGPTVYGLFEGIEAAAGAQARLREEYPFVRAVSPVPAGVRVLG